MKDDKEALVPYQGGSRIELSQGVETDMLRQIKDTAIKRVAARYEAAKQRLLEFEQAVKAENDKIIELENLQKEYDDRFEADMNNYEAELIKMEEDAEKEYEQAMLEYDADKEKENERAKAEQAQQQAESDLDHEKKCAEYDSVVAEYDKQYDVEFKRCRDHLPEYLEQVRERCTEPGIPFLAKNMVEYILDNSDKIAQAVIKAFSGKETDHEAVLVYIINKLVFPHVMNEPFNVADEARWNDKNGCYYRNGSDRYMAFNPNSVLKELDYFIGEITARNMEHASVGGKLVNIIKMNAAHEADMTLKDLFNQFIKEVWAVLPEHIETAMEDMGMHVFRPRLSSKSVLKKEPFEADFSDAESIKMYLAYVLELLSHKKMNPALPEYKVPDKPERKEISLNTKKIKKPEKRVVTLKKPRRKNVGIPEPGQIEKPAIEEQIPVLDMTECFEGLPKLREHLKIFMIRMGIVYGFYNATVEPAHEGKKRFFLDTDNAIYKREGEPTAQDSLQQYGDLWDVSIIGFNTTKKDFVDKLVKIEIDPSIEHIYEMAEWIFRNYSLGWLYMTRGTERQKKTGEVLIEMMMVFKEKLREMTVEVEAKIGFGEMSDHRLQKIVQGLADLGNDRTIEQEMERVEKLGSRMADVIEAYADISTSEEEDFDKRLAESAAAAVENDNGETAEQDSSNVTYLQRNGS